MTRRWWPAAPVRRWMSVAPLVVLLVAVTAACSGDQTPSPFADCSSITSTPPAPGSAPAAAPDASSIALAGGLPDLELPCFTGDKKVALRDLHGPAVINLWASWCGPCRAELPVVQQFADQAGAQVIVLGVDTGDTRDAGASFAGDKAVRMPTLFDQDKKLLNALGRTNLPVTIFVDATGKATVHLLPLDKSTLPEQVRDRTGVTVTK